MATRFSGATRSLGNSRTCSAAVFNHLVYFVVLTDGLLLAIPFIKQCLVRKDIHYRAMQRSLAASTIRNSAAGRMIRRQRTPALPHEDSQIHEHARGLFPC